MITPEYSVVALVGLLFSVVGFFVIRSINQFDKMIAEHDKKLASHDALINEMMIDIKQIQVTNQLYMKAVTEKLDYIMEKIDSHDEIFYAGKNGNKK